MVDSSLTIRPMTEADLSAYDRILASAFSGGIMDLFYPNGYTPADRTHSLRSTLKKLRHDPIYKFMAVIDTSLDPLPQDLEPLPSEVIDPEKMAEIETVQAGRPIGFAVWKLYAHDRSEAEIAAEAKAAEAEGFPPNGDRKMMADFFGSINEAKKKNLGGRAYMLLHILVTDPAHHRRGVGALQLKWGLDEADKLGLPAYLEASPMGRPLYAKWGFEALGPLDFDATLYGGSKDMEHTIMLRPAVVKEALRSS